MASTERRMLFDLRGKRKRVVQVAYVILALLMAFSLFSVVGPLNIGSIFSGNSGTSAGSALDKQAAQIQAQLQANPKDPALLLQLTRTRVSAGNAKIKVNASTQQQSLTPQATSEYQQASDAWARYMALKPKNPSVPVAALASSALFYAAGSATTAPQFTSSIDAALSAQQIVAQARPTLNSYLVLAQYSYLAGDQQQAAQAAAKARSLAGSKRQPVDQALGQYQKLGTRIQKQVKALSKASAAQGKQGLQNPLGGLSGGGGGGLSGGGGGQAP